MNVEMITLHVVVAGLVPEETMDKEDCDVPGIYAVKVPSNLVPGIQAGLALDLFHAATPIAMLEDFEITVIEPATKAELEQAPNYDASSVAASGEFLGWSSAL